MAVVGADEGVGAALGEDQLVVLGDLLGEAHAPVAEDAALAVDRHQRRQGERLLEVALGLDEAAAAQAPAEGDVLQRALAALVADRAVERVVDEQELHDRVLGLADALGLGVDDHPVLDRGRAARLQLGDALHLDQAHPAGADGLAELGLVAEVRDLDVALLGGVDEHGALDRLHLAAVDRQLDGLALWTWHAEVIVSEREGDRRARRPPPTRRRPAPRRRRRARAPPRSRPRAQAGTSRPSSRSASPWRRPARTGSCR